LRRPVSPETDGITRFSGLGMNNAFIWAGTRKTATEDETMNGLLTTEKIREQNLAFAGISGVSQENSAKGFRAAFCDALTGRAELARFSDGSPAPVHVLEGVPAAWVARRDTAGRVSAVKKSIIAGFIRDGFFYTREQAAAAALQATR
jgi:hypothetical protein